VDPLFSSVGLPIVAFDSSLHRSGYVANSSGQLQWVDYTEWTKADADGKVFWDAFGSSDSSLLESTQPRRISSAGPSSHYPLLAPHRALTDLSGPYASTINPNVYNLSKSRASGVHHSEGQKALTGERAIAAALWGPEEDQGA
jgi:hypothetical protein